MPSKNPFDFTGKTVVLAGATGGLGHPISIAFAQGGANLACCARNASALAKLAEELREAPGDIFTASVDLCVEAEVHDFVETVRARFGRIDVLVTLVGGIIRKPSLEYSLNEWQHVMDVNLKACWLICQAVGRVMVAQG